MQEKLKNEYNKKEREILRNSKFTDLQRRNEMIALQAEYFGCY